MQQGSYNPAKVKRVQTLKTGSASVPSQGITRRKAIKIGVFTLATALPVVMTMWPKEAHGQSS